MPSRRQVLGLLAAGTGFAVASGGCSGSDGDAAPGRDRSRAAAGGGSDAGGRVLVVVELNGGNDGLSTVVPHIDPRYRELRPTLALGDDEVVPFDGDLALNRALEPLVPHGLAALSGVGTRRPSLSHFDMLARWWSGSPDPGTGGEGGFLARLCGRLGDATSPTGMSISGLPSPAIAGGGPSAVTIPSAVTLGGEFAGSAAAGDALLTALGALGASHPGSRLGDLHADGLRQALVADRLLSELPPVDERYGPLESEHGPFAAQMGFASQLIRARNGVRVLHVPMGSTEFDTHAAHRPRHARLMSSLGSVLAAFLDDLRGAGMGESVLVATTSEFGRRVQENEGGLDHGAGSTALLVGPVVGGVHGDGPDLDRLDDAGNLIAPIPFDRYLASLAAWLDVDPQSVLEGAPSVVPGLIRT